MRRALAVLLIAMGALSAAPAVAQDTAAEPRTEKPPKQASAFEHPSVRLGQLKVDIRGFLQTSALESDSPNDPSEGRVGVPHRRVGLDGTLGKMLGFQIEGELGTTSPWRDLYVDYRQLNVLRVKAGQFKLPFSLERNTGASDLDFAFRSESASELAPGRQTGIMAHGRIWKRVLEYEVGIFPAARFNPDASYGGLAHSRKTTAGRLTVRPFSRSKSSLDALRLAAAFTAGGQSEGISDLRGRNAFGTPFFSRSYWVKGSRQRTGFEAQWQPGPISLTWEYMRVLDERREQGIGGEDLAPLRAGGWYMSGTWAITGESKSRGIQTPRHPLFQGGVGAVELAARIERIHFGDGIKDPLALFNPRAEHAIGNADRILTVGVNWYVNRWMKAQANVIRESLADSSAGSLAGRPRFWSRVLALQLTL